MINIIRRRRSIRKYKSIAIEKEKINLLKETALRVPTGNNIQPCRFFFIENKERIRQLSKCKPGAEFIEKAALLVLVAAEKDISNTWIEDCSIASIMLQLESEALGLGSCWIQIRGRYYDKQITSEEYISNILNLSEIGLVTTELEKTYRKLNRIQKITGYILNFNTMKLII